MFDRFTDNARKAMDLAFEEAKRTGDGSVRPEHLLRVLIRSGREFTAGRVVEDLCVDLEELLHDVESLERRDSTTGPGNEPPHSPEMMKVIDLSREEADRLGQNYIGTEHLLLGLLRKNGLRVEQARTRLLEVLCQRALDFAREEAHRRGHGFVGMAHLLLGLLREDKRATAVLTDLGVTPEKLEVEFPALLECELGAFGRKDLDLLPLAKRALDRCWYEVKILGSNELGSEHLLLGLLAEPDGAASRILGDLGLDLEEVRRRALRLATGDTEREASS